MSRELSPELVSHLLEAAQGVSEAGVDLLAHARVGMEGPLWDETLLKLAVGLAAALRINNDDCQRMLSRSDNRPSKAVLRKRYAAAEKLLAEMRKWAAIL